MSQTDFGLRVGVAMKTQLNYEAGERSPDGVYFAALAGMGIDVRYVITGSRDYVPAAALSAEEQVLLDHYRAATREVRNAALGALLGAQSAKRVVNQVFRGPVGQRIDGDVGHATVSMDLRTTKPPKGKP